MEQRTPKEGVVGKTDERETLEEKRSRRGQKGGDETERPGAQAPSRAQRPTPMSEYPPRIKNGLRRLALFFPALSVKDKVT
jgi:hypothetical protein